MRRYNFVDTFNHNQTLVVVYTDRANPDMGGYIGSVGWGVILTRKQTAKVLRQLHASRFHELESN